MAPLTLPHQQAIMVEHLASDPKTTEEEHLRLTMVQMDMERLKFVVRSYVRIRLHKARLFSNARLRFCTIELERI